MYFCSRQHENSLKYCCHSQRINRGLFVVYIKFVKVYTVCVSLDLLLNHSMRSFDSHHLAATPSAPIATLHGANMPSIAQNTLSLV